MADFREHYSFLVGHNIVKAIQMVETTMWIRVIKRNGVDIPVDSSYRENRINVETENGKVTRLISMG